MSDLRSTSTKRHEMRETSSLPDLSRRNRSERNRVSQGRASASGNKSNVQNAVNPSDVGKVEVQKQVYISGGDCRIRVSTERGVEYNKSLHDKNRRRAMKNVKRIATSIEPLFNSDDNAVTVKKKLLEIDYHFAEAVESHGKYHILVNDKSEREDSSMWMNDQDSMVFEIKRCANNWLKDIEKQLQENTSITRSKSEHTQQHKKQQHFQRTLEEFTNNWHDVDNQRDMESSHLLRNNPRQTDQHTLVNNIQMHHPHLEHIESQHITRSRAPSRASSRVSIASSVFSNRSVSRSVMSNPSISVKHSNLRSRRRSNSEPPDNQVDSRKSYASKQGSSASSNLSRYIEQKAKIAALKAEAKFLKESRHKDRGSKEWEIDKEIAKAEAVADVYAEEEGRLNSNERKDEIHSVSVNKVNDPKPNVGSECIESSLVKLLKLQTAPTVDIDPFDGDPLEYNYFVAAFNEAVEEKVEDPRGRLTRLIQYTKGEAKDLIKNCIQEEPERGYEHARSLLKDQYGNPHTIARAYIRELHKWETLKVGDSKGFRKFYSFLVKCNTCMSSGIYLKELNSPDILQVLQSKLPYNMQDKWNRFAVKSRTQEGKEADFNDFLKMVQMETLVANDPMYSREAMSGRTGGNQNKMNQQKPGMQNYAVELPQKQKTESSDEIPKEKLCVSCQNEHDLDKCPEYTKLEVKGRKAFLFKKRLCFCCYKSVSSTHKAGTCTNKRKCDICDDLHPTGLHITPKIDESTSDQHKADGSKTSEVIAALATSCDGKKDEVCEPKNRISMCIVPVNLHHKQDPNNVITVYAMLDNCSEGTFITSDVLEMLKAPVRKTNISIKTLTGEINEDSVSVEDLHICATTGFDGNPAEILKLPKTYTRLHLPIGRHNIPTQERIEHWKHLKDIINEIPKIDNNIPIGLLVGGDCAKAMEPHKVIPSSNGGPYAVRTPLGWCVSGPVSSSESFSDENLFCNMIAVEDVSTGQVAEHHFTIKDEMRDNEIRDALLQMYQTEFTENLKENKALSVEDRKFIDIMNNRARMKCNHRELPLPLTNEQVNFPNNRSIALQRIESLKRRFQKDTTHHQEYTKFMNKLLERGYAREVSVEELSEKTVWYIPHHGVVQKNKPVRPVFDCGAKFQGRSLNDELLPGPDMTNLLLGVLLRFRLEEVPVMADIESMFYQVYVFDEDRRLLRFLWWPDGDFSKEFKEYEMCVHVFGAVSSGSCANYALQKTAAENEIEFGAEAAATLRSNFYVDDMLKSLSNSEDAVHLIRNIINMCEAGGFNLTKFVSTDKTVLESLPTSKLLPKLQEYDLSKCSLQIERALGVHWCLVNDELLFKIEFHDSPLNKRGMLKTVSSIYDPPGLGSPFILEGRKILQEIVNEKKNWDDKVMDIHRMRWEKWRSNLIELKQIRIRRCLKPKGFGKSVSTSFHHFADASEIGYGVGSYIRQVNERGEINVSLVMGKSWVAPTRAITIPRLELTAAVVAAKVSNLLNKELDISSVDNVYWSDSKIALGYISNETKRFRVFVANRAQKIRELTDTKK